MTLVWASSAFDLKGLAAFRVEHTDDRAVVIAAGEVDLFTAPALREAVLAATQVSDALVIDLTDVRFIDSTGIGVLVGAAGRPRRRQVALVGPTPMMCKVLQVTGLDQVFPVFATMQEALAQDAITTEHAP
jgi:anti-sigma B factor antagonist